MHHPTDWITHTTAFVTPVEEHWLEREIAQWVHVSEKVNTSVFNGYNNGENIIAKARKEGKFYLTTHSTHYIYGYMASDIW